jgi:hypothetical protein
MIRASYARVCASAWLAHQGCLRIATNSGRHAHDPGHEVLGGASRRPSATIVPVLLDLVGRRAHGGSMM